MKYFDPDHPFAEEMRRHLERSQGDPESAAAGLVKLARRAGRNRSTPGAWYEQQCLSFAGTLYDVAGQPARAARIFERVARLAQSEANYYSRAAASVLAEASRLRFLSGDTTRGERNAKEALKLVGRYPTPGLEFEEMLKIYREHLERNAARRKTRRK